MKIDTTAITPDGTEIEIEVTWREPYEYDHETMWYDREETIHIPIARVRELLAELDGEDE